MVGSPFGNTRVTGGRPTRQNGSSARSNRMVLHELLKPDRSQRGENCSSPQRRKCELAHYRSTRGPARLSSEAPAIKNGAAAPFFAPCCAPLLDRDGDAPIDEAAARICVFRVIARLERNLPAEIRIR